MNMRLRGMGDAAYDALFAKYAANRVPADVFLEHFGGPEMGGPYEPPDPVVCLKIQCGVITQEQAGQKVLFSCANSNFTGVRSCYDPLCAPYCGSTAKAVARAAQPLPVAPRVEETFRRGPARGCHPIYTGDNFSGPYSDAAVSAAVETADCCGLSSAIDAHPFLAIAAAIGGAWLIRKAAYGR
jgi:hypothetical protein